MNHAQAVIVITGAFGAAAVVFTYLVIRAQERRAARFLTERDGR